MFDWRRAGSWCGLAGPSIFLITWLAAIASTPGYRVFEHWVSDLGVGGGAAFFNGGVIVAGLLTIPFAVTLALVLQTSRLGLVGSAVLIVASVALIGVGVFTENAGRMHGIMSISFFASVLLALILLSWPLYRFPAFGPWVGLTNAVLVLVGLLMAAVSSSGPFTETVVVLMVAAWSIVVAWKLRMYLCVTLRQQALGPEAQPNR